MSGLKEKNSIERSREHLVNERTFLAWIRTSIAFMGFGFIIVKFTLFLKQLSILVEINKVPAQGYSSLIGVIMVAVGVIISVMAFIKYKKNYLQLENNNFVSSSMMSLLITLLNNSRRHLFNALFIIKCLSFLSLSTPDEHQNTHLRYCMF